MDATERRTRFERRVSTERDFITPVNQFFGQRAPLAGMTLDAIRSWRRRAELASGQSLSMVESILLEASARADLMADNSKDVFEPERRPGPDSLGDLITMLNNALADLDGREGSRSV